MAFTRALTETDKITLEKLSAIYRRNFQKPCQLGADVRTMLVDRDQRGRPLNPAAPSVSRVINYLLCIYGPRGINDLNYVTELSRSHKLKRTALFIVCTGLVVFRGANEWHYALAPIQAMVERRKTRGDLVSLFLHTFTNYARDLVNLQMLDVELQLFHALLALSPRRQDRGCGGSEGCRCPAEMKLRCEDVWNAVRNYLKEVYGEEKGGGRWERLMREVEAACVIATLYASRLLDIPLLQSVECVCNFPVCHEDNQMLSVVFDVDDYPSAGNALRSYFMDKTELCFHSQTH